MQDIVLSAQGLTKCRGKPEEKIGSCCHHGGGDFGDSGDFDLLGDASHLLSPRFTGPSSTFVRFAGRVGRGFSVPTG